MNTKIIFLVLCLLLTMNYDMTPQLTGKDYYFYFIRSYAVFLAIE